MSELNNLICKKCNLSVYELSKKFKYCFECEKIRVRKLTLRRKTNYYIRNQDILLNKMKIKRDNERQNEINKNEKRGRNRIYYNGSKIECNLEYNLENLFI